MKTMSISIIAVSVLLLLIGSCSENASITNTSGDMYSFLEKKPHSFEFDDRFHPIEDKVREAIDIKNKSWRPSPYCVEAQQVKETMLSPMERKTAILRLRKKYRLEHPPIRIHNKLPPLLRNKGTGKTKSGKMQKVELEETKRNLAKTQYHGVKTALNFDLNYQPRRVFLSQWIWEDGTNHHIEFHADCFWCTDAVLVVFRSMNYPRTLNYADINTLEVVAWDDNSGTYENPSIDFTACGSFPYNYYFVLLFADAPYEDGDGTLIIDDYSTRASATGYAYWGSPNKSDNLYETQFFQIADNTSAGADPWIWAFDFSNLGGYTNDDNTMDQQDAFYYYNRQHVEDPLDYSMPINGTFTYLKSGGDNRRSKIRTYGYQNSSFQTPNCILLTGYHDSNTNVRFVGYSVPYPGYHPFYVYPDAARVHNVLYSCLFSCHSNKYQ